jgi:hypothetical protein
MRERPRGVGGIKRIGVEATLLVCIMEMLGSSLSWNTG